MGILLGILELIKVGIIYSLIFLFNNGFSLIITVCCIIALLNPKVDVESVFVGLVFAWVMGLIIHLLILMDKNK